ncbi:MAG TPA: DUF4928 family protein [Verrucomicrobiae bacterium]|nr:DUF4928 family protein [Verrucomicrobiae bacterium]
MSTTTERLEELCKQQSKFPKQTSGLCVALVITRTAKKKGLPLDPRELLTDGGGQVAGLGKAPVQKILGKHGISKILSEEGGRTSRGTPELMRAYVAVLNELAEQESLDLDEVEAFWIEKVRVHFASEGPKFHFDPGKSLHANIHDLLEQAAELQRTSGGRNYVGAMLQHLVGAKLDVVLGIGKIEHHGSSVADRPTDRNGDFQIETVAIHVTTHPTEALVRKCHGNLRSGLKPVIITLWEGVEGAAFLLKGADLADRVDVLDVGQFLTANVYERSFFKVADCEMTFSKLLDRYNEIVGACESDPALRIALKADEK